MAASFCAKCRAKLDEGITRCPSCNASLAKPGNFTEVLGWVVAIISSIPIIIGEKTVSQGHYAPMVTGGVILFVGIVLIFVGRSKSRTAEETVVREDAGGAAS